MPAKASAAKKPKRQRLPGAERKEQIIAAAQRVFVRQGFHGTRTRDLAAEAGVNEATLFLYFASKRELFDAAITSPMQAMVKHQMAEGRAFASAPDPDTKERIGMQAIRELYVAIAEMSPLLIAALFHDRAQGQEIYRTDVYPLLRKLRAATRISFETSSDAESEFIALAAMGLCFSIQLNHSLLGTQPDLDEMATRIAGLLLHGGLKRGTES